jgi:hypothetical protein
MRILVAEDHNATRLIIEAAVRPLGHDCVSASDGEEAWQLFVPTLRSPSKHRAHSQLYYFYQCCVDHAVECFCRLSLLYVVAV